MQAAHRAVYREPHRQAAGEADPRRGDWPVLRSDPDGDPLLGAAEDAPAATPYGLGVVTSRAVDFAHVQGPQHDGEGRPELRAVPRPGDDMGQLVADHVL